MAGRVGEGMTDAYNRLCRWRDVGDDPRLVSGTREFTDCVIELLATLERLRAPADEALVRQVATAITYVHGTAMDKARAVLAEVVPAIRAAERERCAKVADRLSDDVARRALGGNAAMVAGKIAATIRAGGEGG